MSVTKVPMKGINTAVDTAAGDDANIGYTAAEGLILTGQGSTDDITIKNDADTTVVNVATGGTDVEISAGNILFGTANKGVYLGVTSATAANLLDDYEEGTFTPTAASNFGGGSLSNAEGYYTKVGNIVTVALYGLLSQTSDGSSCSIDGLPFDSASSTNVHWPLTQGATTSDLGPLYPVVSQGYNELFWYTTGSSPGSAGIPSYTEIGTNDSTIAMAVAGTYRV